MSEHNTLTPLPGTFYRSPSPGAPAFVREGDAVTAETVIGVVELMKQFTEVLAGAAGTLRAFVVDDGDTVDSDQPVAMVAVP
ncbi:acetyl-CoA carboxylase [Paraburkholderia nemoris]|uniref:Biotin carboxyl carrier protein of acetyl-CoA carboxylase n=1 Tax=Paraburkholderia nemoris TaxID=2793076 RepID=A0ABM8SXC5_9BURK|nr:MULTISPECIES: acetyl-CoA carboxylase [Paraburkholderia]MBK3815216.1 biotin carboxyl carrier domain-containing protein [Paraburkholderia aspalathi]CAE6713934.1 Biotin carboxyl carrier protein of acetyl-CoA carboxylase [Paraburkholderia nemoris]CAE6839718.1 Biotin carboxyl carrier protein of acetyl-CoA carboxylase [Paraburkholderia nemoris]